MKSKFLFDKDTTYQDVVDLVGENLDLVFDLKDWSGYFDDQAAIQGLMSLKEMDNKKKELFFKFVRAIDSKVNFAGQGRKNIRKKIPAILAGAIYFDKYLDNVKRYSVDELIAICCFSPLQELDFYAHINEYFPKELMTEIVNKQKGYDFHTDYMTVCNYRRLHGDTDLVNYVRNTSASDLMRECCKIESDFFSVLFGEDEKSESRRF